MKKLIFLFLSLILVCPPVWAANLVKSVKQSGGDYTTMNACVTGNAQDMTSPGFDHLVCEAQGTWSVDDAVGIDFNTAGYTNLGPSHKIILRAADDGAMAHDKAGTTNYRLVVDGFLETGIQMSTTPYIEVRNLVIGSASSLSNNGIALPQYPIVTNDTVIDGNIIYGFQGRCIDGSGAPNDVRITNNVMYNCDTGVYLDTPYDDLVENNSIGAMTSSGYGIRILTAGTGNIAKNNLVITGRTDFVFSTVTHSNNFSGDSSGDTGSKSASTEWTDSVTTHDFTLKLGATAIDSGADLSSTFTNDFNGTTRPQGSAFDIGADEYSAGGGGGGIVHRRGSVVF